MIAYFDYLEREGEIEQRRQRMECPHGEWSRRLFPEPLNVTFWLGPIKQARQRLEVAMENGWLVFPNG